MAEPNETHVVYKAIADFASLRRELTKTKAALAEMKAAEDAYNAASAKGSPAATKAAQQRAKALQGQAKTLRTVVTQINNYAKATAAQTTATVASTKAIQAQNRALATNRLRYIAAAKAARDYAKALKSPTGGLATSKPDAGDSAATSASRSARALKEEAAALSTTSAGRQRRIREQKAEAQVVNAFTGEIMSATDAAKKLTSATEGLSVSTQKYKRDANGVMRVVFDSRDAMKDGARATQTAGNAFERARNALRGWANDGNRTMAVQRRLGRQTSDLYRNFVRFGNWRPRLIPPFVALVPIIGAVIAAINPLVAIIGSASPLVLGLASSVGSLSGAFLALPGILSGVVAGISSVIASMGGVGSVFKAYGAMRKAISAPGGGGGSRGETQAERAERLADAEWNLQKAQRAVLKAQENLNKARERALQNLVELRLEVSRASMNEERAIANLAQAQQDYWNTMADPGSTAADKLDAAVSIKEAEADLQDVRQKNIDNQKELNELEAKGIDQSDEVLDAQERLTDAMISQRDAQKALTKEQTGAGTAGANAITSATNEFNDALNKLSPSARAVVLALLALEGQWKAMRATLQETFFSQFVGDMDKLPQIIRNIEAFLKPAAAAMGLFVSSLITLLASPEWTSDLATIGEQNGVVLTQLGEAALWLATALKDLIIAAGPFTEWMLTGFAEGSKRFSEFIASARETGSLAGWLLKVETRLQRWWAIIKNVSATLFNYSAASSEFGDWLTDGLLKTTEAWRKASQDARKEGSPFQAYLEDVKPLLQEVKGLFRDFFGWLRREMMDPENIKGATDLLRVIRSDLGPALSRFLDTLSSADIDIKFVHALSAIVNSVSAIMEKGGSKALETFFNIIVGFFDTMAGFVNAIPESLLSGLLTFVGSLAALAFVGKFTGITNLVGALTGLSRNAGSLGGMFSQMKGLDKLKFVGIMGLLSALVSLPELLGSARDMLNGVLGVDMSDIESSARYLANSRDLLGRKNSNKYSENEFNQSRNWVFDAGRQFIGSDAAWQKVDDQLREILKTGDIEAFQAAWAKVVDAVGSDASQIWSLTLKDAEAAGIKVSDTSTKIRILGEKSKESEEKIRRLRDELSMVGGTAMDQGRAFDRLAESIESLADLPPVTVGELDSQTESARALRDRFREIETDARNAAQSILDNGGSVDEARAKYDEGRGAIEKYLEEMGLGPDEARAWADGTLGPAEEVRAKFNEIKTELDKLKLLNDMKLKLSLQLEGFEKVPTTMVDGREVVDFAAWGKQTKQKQPAPTSIPGMAGGGGGGGGGGGFSVGLTKPIDINPGVADAVTKDTTKAQGVWNQFWSNFNRPIPGPLGVLQSAIGNAFTWIQNNPFRGFENAGNSLRMAFERIVSGIGSAWSNLQNVFSGPANFVIDSVYNNGIRAFWNNLASKLNMNHLQLPAAGLIGGRGSASGALAGGMGRFARGGVLPGYTPGRDVHDFYSPTAGNLHLSGGEAIMRPEWTKAVGGEKAVAQMNADARNNRFALGGVIGLGAGAGGSGKSVGSGNNLKKGVRSNSQQRNSDSWVSEISGAAQFMLDFFKDPVGMVTRGATNAISGMLGQIGGGQYGELLKGIPTNIISGLGNVAKNATPAYGGDYKGGAGAGMGWQAMIQIVRSAFPGTRLNSGYRPGDPTMHGKGRAIDIPPDPQKFAWLRKNFPNSQALIYSPMGGQQLLNGRPYVWPEPYKSTHYDHIHWGMKDGGVLPKLYDQGGWIPHGGAALNLSGKPEAVLNPSESAALKSLLSGSGLAGRPAFGASAATAISPVSSVVDASVNIENVTIVNPAPEKLSDSLPKAIRKIGYMKNAREGMTP